ETVIVVVGDADPVGPADCSQPRVVGNVGEGAVTIVPVKAIGGLLWITFQTRAREQKDIHPSIVVVVDEGAATAIGLQNVFLRFDAAIDHRRAKPSLLGDIGETGIK